MKNTILLGLIFLVFGTTTVAVLSEQSLKDEIVRSFSTGDIQSLTQSFADDILLELFDKDEYEDPSEIEKRLDTFFKKYPPKKFTIKHEGGAGHQKYSYLIGILQTKEEVFRVSFTMEADKISNINIIFEVPFS